MSQSPSQFIHCCHYHRCYHPPLCPKPSIQLFSWIPNRPLPSSGVGQLVEALRCPPPETRSTGCCESIDKWLYFSSWTMGSFDHDGYGSSSFDINFNCPHIEWTSKRLSPNAITLDAALGWTGLSLTLQDITWIPLIFVTPILPFPFRIQKVVIIF